MGRQLTQFAGPVPACYQSSQQYEEWKYWARLACEDVSEAGPCTDCNPKFQAEMIWCGRCENPFVEFKMFPVKMHRKYIGDELRGYVDVNYANQEKE
jgi:hypothetical protein